MFSHRTAHPRPLHRQSRAVWTTPSHRFGHSGHEHESCSPHIITLWCSVVSHDGIALNRPFPSHRSSLSFSGVGFQTSFDGGQRLVPVRDVHCSVQFLQSLPCEPIAVAAIGALRRARGLSRRERLGF